MPTTRADPSRNAPPGSVCVWDAFGQYACKRATADSPDLFRPAPPATTPSTQKLTPYLPLPESFVDGGGLAPHQAAPSRKAGAPALHATATLEGFCGCGGPAPVL